MIRRCYRAAFSVPVAILLVACAPRSAEEPSPERGCVLQVTNHYGKELEIVQYHPDRGRTVVGRAGPGPSDFEISDTTLVYRAFPTTTRGGVSEDRWPVATADPYWKLRKVCFDGRAADVEP